MSDLKAQRPPRDTDFLLLDGGVIDALMTQEAAIACAERALRKTSNGSARQDLRRTLALPGAAGSCLSMMVADIDDSALCGAKVLSVFPGNFAQGLGSHRGIVVLFEKSHGRPVALLDGGALTAWRTAAASAVATRVLSRPESRTLTLIGYGEQARCHVAALAKVRPIRALRICGRNPAKAEAFATEFRARGFDARAIADPAQAVAEADIVCTTTSAETPVLLGDWLRPGTHVNAVGASVPACRELDRTCVTRASIWVDSLPMALCAAGELIDALETGALAREDLRGEIGAVLEGTAPGRRSPEEITLYRSLGVPAQDIELANHLVSRARAAALGRHLDFGL
jgi:ornithine cyclodeaminase